MSVSLLEFAIVWFFATVPLGVNALASIDAAIYTGWPRALLVPVGITCAALIYAIFAVTGLSSLLKVFPWLGSFIAVVGGCYLVYVGIRIARRATITLTDGDSTDSNARLFLKGLGTSLSNPKAALVYLAVVPKYLDNATSLERALAIIGTIIAIVFSVYFCYSLGAQFFRNVLLKNQRYQQFLNIASALGFFFIAFLIFKFGIESLNVQPVGT